MKKAATKHAPVTQAIRDAIHKLQTTCTQRFDVEFDGELPDPTDDELFAWLADYSAEVERKARLDEARRWERFHYGQPPEGEELYWNQKRIAELGGTK